jgi:hypothetical protein
MDIICRKKEQEILDEVTSSNQPEFLALYGRRRIGKTFLVREYFENKPVVFFNTTGSKDGTMAEQIIHFTQTIGDTFHHGIYPKEMDSWDATFRMLTKAMKESAADKPIVLFMDEFPWMASPKSRLLGSLDYYWNQFWSRDPRTKLIICGSSASWVIKHIINNRGGLHNRITRKMLLKPFNLSETKRFLESNGVNLNNDHIIKLYMVTGGVPYYLSKIKKGLSSTQIIEQLAFQENGLLISEFDNLFASLFKNSEVVIELIYHISSKRYGIGQAELFKLMNGNIKGKQGLTKLKELEDTGFIRSFMPYQHKQKGVYYKVIDEYTLFYLRWIKPIKDNLLKGNLEPSYWEKEQSSGAWYSWAGLAFESICYKHLPQIRRTLNLPANALPSTWRAVGGDEATGGAQIDLLFDRGDNAITLCEIKYTSKPFAVNKQLAQSLEAKKAVFLKKTKTTKQIFFALVSANGVTQSEDAGWLDGVVTLDGLFNPV